MKNNLTVILGTLVALAATGCVTALAILGTIPGGEAYGFYTMILGGGAVGAGHAAAKKG